MSNSDIQISESDFFICVAFQEMLGLSGTEEQKKLDRETAISIAHYLTELPPEDKLKPAAMANHITAFCQQRGNEQLNEWLGEIYDPLDEDGIDKLEKKTGDPDKKAYGLPTTGIDLENEGRDARKELEYWETEGRNACEALQKWATEKIEQN